MWLAAMLVLGAGYASPAPFCEIADRRVNESSGLAASRVSDGVFYTHNDSGDGPRFFRFDRRGAITGVFDLAGVSAVDWEDMAAQRVVGRNYLYLGDIGDNSRRRVNIRVYRLEEPTGQARSIRTFETYTLTYPDGKWDCEALFVDPRTGDMYFVTKVAQGPSGVYYLPAQRRDGVYTLTKLGTVEIDTGGLGGRLVTGADMRPDGRAVIVRTYTGALEFPVGMNPREWFRQKPTAVRTATEQQGEAICYSRDGKMLLTTSEGTPCQVSSMASQP